MDNYSFLVLGSNSFTGSHFIAYLLNHGFKVFGVSRSPELANPFLAYKWNKVEKDNYKFFQYDLNRHQNEISELIKKEQFSHIINFAAQSMVGQSWTFPEDWYNTNLVSLSSLINKIKDFDHLERFVSITTPEVYGSTDGWVKENFNFSPSTPYAISRAAQDLHLKAYFDNFNFPISFTRAANVYGPGQSLYRIIPRAIIEALTDGTLTLDGGGKSTRSFIHIKDVCDATFKVSLHGSVGSCYHISTNETIKIIELVELVSKICNISFDEFVKVGPDRAGKDAAYLLDSSKIRDELGWSDTISLEAGIHETLEWVKREFEFLRKFSREYEHKI